MFQSLLIFFLFILIIIGIGKYFIDIVITEEGLREDEQVTEEITVTQEERVEWEELSAMITNCKVDQVIQTHDLSVSVVTEDDEIYWAKEPAIDDVLHLARQASRDCDKDIIQITE